MRNLVILLFFLNSFLFTANSQVITEAEMHDLLKSQKIKLENPIIRDFVSMSQIQEDIATINPHSGLSVQILQYGNRNNGIIEQIGYGLNTYLSQDGSFNEANLWSEGNNIHTQAKQDGDGNVINSYIKNYDLDKRSAMLLQEGNYNRIDLAIYGDDAPAAGLTSREIKIAQQGSNHAVEAFMENDFRSMEINQTSGVNGEGMKIDVSTSTFSFPMKR